MYDLVLNISRGSLFSFINLAGVVPVVVVPGMVVLSLLTSVLPLTLLITLYHWDSLHKLQPQVSLQ